MMTQLQFLSVSQSAVFSMKFLRLVQKPFGFHALIRLLSIYFKALKINTELCFKYSIRLENYQNLTDKEKLHLSENPLIEVNVFFQILHSYHVLSLIGI